MRTMKNKITALLMAFAFAASLLLVSPVAARAEGLAEQDIAKKVRHELVTLPWYGVFDNLAYKIEGGTVTLYGQVVRPTTRSDAERRVKRISGVSQVVNNIEVLPLSSFDDALRMRAYRTIFRTGGLYRYAMGTNPSIHIIVNRGHLTLEGVVSTTGDKRLAYIAARGIPGVFSVTNNLRAESELPR